MKIKKVWSVYFSATTTTEKVVRKIADVAAEKLGAERAEFDFTLPGARADVLSFGEEDLVIFGTPVYAGRIPNLLLKYVVTVQGNGALAVPVVLYGNRNPSLRLYTRQCNNRKKMRYWKLYRNKKCCHYG